MQPISTYRLQLTAEFGFAEATAQVPYLASLGVTHLYCSPWLESEQDSTHGYDVVDHSRVDGQLGGAAGLEQLSAACRQHGLGIVLDIVPNHMSVATAARNEAWWSLLRDGQDSPYAAWFDVDWSKGHLLLPVLGAPLADCLDDLSLDQDRVRYFDHEFPIAPGTLAEGDLEATLAAQHYRLAFWRASDELAYRRFFDVTSLAGVRVERPEVFATTHAVVLDQVRSGIVDGLRVDHPDGLSDPEGYLAQLTSEVPGTWVVVEKILEPGEELPDWPCAGTTGYDAAHQVTGLFVDPEGETALTELWHGPTFADTVSVAKKQVLSQILVAEVERLLDLAVPALASFDVTRHGLREALHELLTAFEVYRAYVPASGPADAVARAHVDAAVRAATEAAPLRAREVALLGRLALAELGCPEFVTRFQQTCGPVMAKGVEDTALYRYTRLLALNEVGGDPSGFGISAQRFHAFCQRRLERWPLTMTALSTHDTKRSEDVRARLVLLSHDAEGWARTARGWSTRMSHRLDHATEQLVWQTLVGAWPLELGRARDYLVKAAREAKCATSWLLPNAEYEQQLEDFLTEALVTLGTEIGQFVSSLDGSWRSTVLAQKLVQLTMPGVADCYQGTELVTLSLVDPDNRRPVDYQQRAALLTAPDDSLDAEKLRVVQTTLQLRREHPEWFLSGSYEPIETREGTLAFSRAGEVVTVVPIRGGVAEPPSLKGEWVDLLPGLPVSLLTRKRA